jgi:hypothetical protein
MGEALSHLIIEKEVENERLKKRVRELEVSLSPKPLFAEPLSMIVPKEVPKEMVGSNSKVTRATKLLMGIRRYVAENIDKRLDII